MPTAKPRSNKRKKSPPRCLRRDPNSKFSRLWIDTDDETPIPPLKGPYDGKHFLFDPFVLILTAFNSLHQTPSRQKTILQTLMRPHAARNPVPLPVSWVPHFLLFVH